MKFALVFFISAITLFLVFYFYPAQIFESKVAGSGSELIIDLSLKNILHGENLPEELNPKNITSIKPTVSGFMILLICLLALPVMIAYRFTLKKKPEETNKQDN